MNIAIDGSAFLLTKGGVTSYLSGLLGGFKQLSPHPHNKIYYFGRDVSTKSKTPIDRLHTIYRELIWQQKIFPRLAEKDRMDILFSPHHLISLKSKIPRVVTFHDMYILNDPKAFRRWHYSFSNYMYPKILNSGAHIIAISNFTRNEILRFFPKTNCSISTIYNGISSEFRVIKDENRKQEVLTRYQLPREFILYVGAIEPRKNLITLLNVIDKSMSGEIPPLVIVSGVSWKNTIEQTLIKKLILQGKVVLLNYVPNDDLVVIFNLAIVFIYPSLYEGFGLPPMEAMACGCPVITSEGSALQELYGDHAVVINPLDSELMRHEIVQMINSETLRKSYSEKGLSLSKKFLWENAAQQTFDLMEKVNNA